jgi:hypothetical protein
MAGKGAVGKALAFIIFIPSFIILSLHQRWNIDHVARKEKE